MALRYEIGQSEYDSLPADVKKEYKKNGSDYRLDLTDDPVAGALSAKENEVKEHANTKRAKEKAEKDYRDAQAKISDLEKSGGDSAAALENQRKELEAKHKADLEAKDKAIADTRAAMIKTETTRLADKIANSISDHPKLLARDIAERIQGTFDEATGTVKTVFLGDDMKPSAMKEADVAKAFSTNKEYAPIIRATRGSGGGSAPPNPSNGRAGQSPFFNAPDGKPQDLTRADPAVIRDQIKQNREAVGS